MKVGISFLCVAVLKFGLAQVTVREYFDQYGDPVPAETSSWFSEGNKNRNGYFYDSVRSYYSNSKTLRSIEIRDPYGNPIGDYQLFYSSGNVQLKGRYERKHFKLFRSSPDSTELNIFQYNDAAGHAQVTNYNGLIDGILDGWHVKGKVVDGLKDSVWTLKHDNGKIFSHESWHHGELVDGVSYDQDEKEHYYNSFLVLPEPTDGVNRFYEQMSDEIVYPKEAQKRGIVGTVEVEFVVGKDGAILSPRIVSGIGFGCDEEAIRVVSLSKPWKPALRRGQPIKHDVIIPFIFRLK